MTQQIHTIVGNATDIILEVGIDAASITNAFIDWCDPDSNTGTWPATPVPGTTSITYQTLPVDLTIPGNWMLQSVVDGNHGEQVPMYVGESLIPIGHPHP